MKKLPLLFLLLFLPLHVLAQDAAASYVREAGVNIPFLRAALAPAYPFLYNGTPRADTLGFREGALVYAGKKYPGLMLDLDAVEQHVLVQLPGSPVVLDVGQKQIGSFSRGDVVYVNLLAMGLNVQPGFYEQMEQGRGTIYRKVSKTLRHLSTLEVSARGLIGYEDPHYRPLLLDYFEYAEVWYLIREDGGVQRLRNKRQINKAYQYIQRHETN